MLPILGSGDFCFRKIFSSVNDELFCYSYYHVMVLMTFYAYVIKLLFIVLFGVLRFLSV